MSSEPWLTDPLDYLIAPTSAADFLARVYEREALVIPHNALTRFEGLLSIDTIDRLVTNVDLKEGQLDLADAARNLQRSAYLDQAGYIDRGAVADHYRAGATIILQQAHQHDPTLARFCRALEAVFSCHVQTNIYLTPPNAQGFRTHYDNHDVFVLQIAGEKDWRLYNKPVDTPFRGERFEQGQYQAGEVRQAFKLHAGDVAYVPRGLMHDAVSSGDTASLHVTVGLITKTWADLMLEAVSEVALRSPEFRKSLPAGYANPGFDRAPYRDHAKKLAEIVAREIDLDPAMDLLADSFIRSRGADNRASITDAFQTIEAADRFQLRAHAPYRLAEDGDNIVLIAPGGEINFTEPHRPALDRALNGAPFTLADISAENAQHFIYRLLAYGVITRV